tara:strand:+ start:51 stop:227 length:177 start_codon:yes stop_codon:yes gene_type:complete
MQNHLNTLSISMRVSCKIVPLSLDNIALVAPREQGLAAKGPSHKQKENIQIPILKKRI